MDLGERRPLGTHRRRLLALGDLATWLTATLGRTPGDLDLYARALTHGSHSARTYERLEFLGDRVLGLAVSRWLYAQYPDETEGELSRRFNALVTGAVCAQVARDIEVTPWLRLGKQALDDGAFASDNILGDVAEALIGALYLDHGFDAADAFVRKHWGAFVEGQAAAPRHPKSALQEWAASNNRKPPAYAVASRSGPHHNPRFVVTVTLGTAIEATGEGTSKQEAETAAAIALLAQIT